MAKPSAKVDHAEKQLYQLFLDLSYSADLLVDYVSDLSDSLKDAKKQLAKTQKLLEKTRVRYKEIYGIEPRSHRN